MKRLWMVCGFTLFGCGLVLGDISCYKLNLSRILSTMQKRLIDNKWNSLMFISLTYVYCTYYICDIVIRCDTHQILYLYKRTGRLYWIQIMLAICSCTYIQFILKSISIFFYISSIWIHMNDITNKVLSIAVMLLL